MPLTAYYTADGTPPGRWLGSGLPGLGDGRIHTGDIVEEAQLAALLGEGRDPVTGEALGRAYPQYTSRAERVAARVSQLEAGLDHEQKAAAIAAIESAEAARPTRRAVAGYDLTCSVPKSVSVLWALAPADVPRAGDPQLHTHVVIANKVQTVMDGRWRSLDGRPVHAAMVALSEHYRAVLADHLTRTLGLTWHQRDHGVDRNPAWDLTGIPDDLVALFSIRSGAIGAAKDDLVAAYVAEHGHQPTARTVLKLRQQATLTTRPDKTVTPLAELMTSWQWRDAVTVAAYRDRYAIASDTPLGDPRGRQHDTAQAAAALRRAQRFALDDRRHDPVGYGRHRAPERHGPSM